MIYFVNEHISFWGDIITLRKVKAEDPVIRGREEFGLGWGPLQNLHLILVKRYIFFFVFWGGRGFGTWLGTHIIWCEPLCKGKCFTEIL